MHRLRCLRAGMSGRRNQAGHRGRTRKMARHQCRICAGRPNITVKPLAGSRRGVACVSHRAVFEVRASRNSVGFVSADTRSHFSLALRTSRCWLRRDDAPPTESRLMPIKSRNALMDAAYDDDIHVADRTIDSHIKRMRYKFKAVDDAFDMIDTLYGVGYRFREV